MSRKTAILISGRGSNMRALVEAARAPGYPATIAIVLSNRADAPGLAWAREMGLQTRIIDHRGFATREAFDAAVTASLETAEVDLIALAGFMRIQSEAFVAHWLGRQINIHPSLLPAFKGLHPQRQAIDAGVRLSGCTVHFVTPEVDAGPIIAQAAVPVLAGDTPSILEARILSAEHRLYPQSLALVASGRVRLAEGRALVSDSPPPQLAFAGGDLTGF